MATKRKSARALVETILLECLKNPQFKQELLDDPDTAVEKLTGSKPSTQLKILENTEKRFYIVLPRLNQDELKDLELQAKQIKSSQFGECYNQMIIRSLQDKNFKDQLIKNPKELIAQECGIQIPQDISIQVIEDTESTTHLALPDGQTSELSQQEINLLSGGTAVQTPGILMIPMLFLAKFLTGGQQQQQKATTQSPFRLG